jgi:hypothetical protein
MMPKIPVAGEYTVFHDVKLDDAKMATFSPYSELWAAETFARAEGKVGSVDEFLASANAIIVRQGTEEQRELQRQFLAALDAKLLQGSPADLVGVFDEARDMTRSNLERLDERGRFACATSAETGEEDRVLRARQLLLGRIAETSSAKEQLDRRWDSVKQTVTLAMQKLRDESSNDAERAAFARDAANTSLTMLSLDELKVDEPASEPASQAQPEAEAPLARAAPRMSFARRLERAIRATRERYPRTTDDPPREVDARDGSVSDRTDRLFDVACRLENVPFMESEIWMRLWSIGPIDPADGVEEFFEGELRRDT